MDTMQTLEGEVVRAYQVLCKAGFERWERLAWNYILVCNRKNTAEKGVNGKYQKKDMGLTCNGLSQWGGKF